MNYQLDIQIDEKSFIDSCKAKEEWALKMLYNNYFSSMLPVCLRYANCESDALDILHEGYIKVFKNIDKYKPHTALNLWIRRIMINTAIDYYRKQKKRRTDSLSLAYNFESKQVSPESLINEKEIFGALQSLTPSYRAVFNLYIIEGYKHKEIAKILNISESTSRSNLVKARNKLKKILLSKGINTQV